MIHILMKCHMFLTFSNFSLNRQFKMVSITKESPSSSSVQHFVGIRSQKIMDFNCTIFRRKCFSITGLNHCVLKRVHSALSSVIEQIEPLEICASLSFFKRSLQCQMIISSEKCKKTWRSRALDGLKLSLPPFKNKFSHTCKEQAFKCETHLK